MIERKDIILDLDQTLIYSEPAETFDFNKNTRKATKFTSHDMDGVYIVFERPHLQDFLTFIFANFNVSVWTAATLEYALFILDKAVLQGRPERKIDYLFFHQHCNLSTKESDKGCTKDLSLLWNFFELKGYSRNNTFILDDYYDDVYLSQPSNVVVATEFIYSNRNSEKDDYLRKLLGYLSSNTVDIQKINNDLIPNSMKKKKN